MAFCKHCGKELKDGEVCSCQGASAAQTAEAATPAPQETPAGGASSVGEAIPSIDTEKLLGSVKEAWKGFRSVFVKPATAGREFVANSSLTTSLFLIIVQALASSFFALILASKINSVIRKTLGLMASFLGSSGKITVLPGAKAFFLTLLFSLLASGLLLLLFLLASLIVKARASWKQLAALVAVRSIAITPLIILSWILVLINPAIGIVVFFGSFLLSMAFLQESVKGIEGLKDNKALYTVFIVLVVFLLVFLFVFSKTAVWYLASEIGELISDPSDLLRMFS